MAEPESPGSTRTLPEPPPRRWIRFDEVLLVVTVVMLGAIVAAGATGVLGVSSRITTVREGPLELSVSTHGSPDRRWPQPRQRGRGLRP